MKILIKIAVILVVIALIIAAVLLIGYAVGWFNVTTDLIGDTVKYECKNQVTEIEIDVGIAELSFKQGEKLSVESNHKYVKINESGGVLKVGEDIPSVGLKVVNVPAITVYLPAGKSFDSVKIKTTAGKVTAETVTASDFRCKLDAGAAVFGELNVSGKTQIEGGAGSIEIHAGSMNNLDIDLGAGSTVIKSRLTGFTTVDCSTGTVNLILLGSSSDYALTVNKGIGPAKLNGQDVEDGKVYGEGENQVRINGGVGSLQISFAL